MSPKLKRPEREKRLRRNSEFTERNERANEAAECKGRMNTRLREARDIFNEEKEALCVSFRAVSGVLWRRRKSTRLEKRKADLAFENKTDDERRFHEKTTRNRRS